MLCRSWLWVQACERRCGKMPDCSAVRSQRTRHDDRRMQAWRGNYNCENACGYTYVETGTAAEVIVFRESWNWSQNCMDGRKAIQRQSLLRGKVGNPFMCCKDENCEYVEGDSISRCVYSEEGSDSYKEVSPTEDGELSIENLENKCKQLSCSKVLQLVCHILRIFRACSITRG